MLVDVTFRPRQAAGPVVKMNDRNYIDSGDADVVSLRITHEQSSKSTEGLAWHTSLSMRNLRVSPSSARPGAAYP